MLPLFYSIGGSHVGVVTFSPVHGEVLSEFKARLYVKAVCMKTMVAEILRCRQTGLFISTGNDAVHSGCGKAYKYVIKTAIRVSISIY